MFQPHGILRAASTLLALCVLAATGGAQEMQKAPDDPHAAIAPPARSFSEAELEAFVDVAMDLQEVVTETRAKMAAASSEAESQKLADAGNEKIQAAIEEHPEMTLETYQAIGVRARQDAAFKKKVDAMFVEAMQAEGGASGG